MPLIKIGETVADTWVMLADDTPTPKSGDIILSFERFTLHGSVRACGVGRSGRLGVVLPNDVDPVDLEPVLDQLALVALAFPAFTDGRAYSQAVLIRDRLGFEGEIRATGHVLADQAAFMLRCGFDAFEIDDRASTETWQSAIGSMTGVYQRGYGRGPGAQRAAG